MEGIEKIIRDRDEALCSLDIKKVRDYGKKYGALPKARTANNNLTEEEKELSRKWLAVRGYHSLG